MTTIQGFLTATREQGTHEKDRARFQREVWALGCHILNRPLAQLLAVDPRESLQREDEDHWGQLITRRLQGEPLAYLLGYADFWTLTLKITPAVLVPRPETEILVERALAAGAHTQALRYADMGTGSGAVALALKKERPAAYVAGFDKSLTALAVAHANAKNLDLAVPLSAGHWLDAVGPGSFDIIVSNPPYIESADPCLQGDGLRYEPPGALNGGPDGLQALKSVITSAVPALRRPGRLLLEHGSDQGFAVTTLLTQAGFHEVITYPDYAGLPRVTEGILHG